MIFADWLDQHGDPWGEFIRIQCELAGTSADDPKCPLLEERESELYDLYHHEWETPLKRYEVKDWRFERGVIEAVTVKLGGSFGRVCELFEVLPTIRDAKFEGNRIYRLFGEFVKADFFEKLSRLDLSRCGLGDKAIEGLMEMPQLRNLISLDLGHNDFGEAGLKAVIRGKYLDSLRSLKLDGNPLSESATGHMARSDWLNQLEELELGNVGLDDPALAIFSSSTNLGSLRSLSLAHGKFKSEGIHYLSRNLDCPELLCLNLWGSGIADAGMAALAQAPTLASLQHLNLSSCHFTLVGLRSLVESPYLENLVSLSVFGIGFPSYLSDWRCRESCVDYLLHKPWFDRLELIDARGEVDRPVQKELQETFRGRLIDPGESPGWMLNYKSLM